MSDRLCYSGDFNGRDHQERVRTLWSVPVGPDQGNVTLHRQNFPQGTQKHGKQVGRDETNIYYQRNDH